MSSESHDPTLISLEAVLRELRPAPGGIDRDALLFRAGQTSARRAGWFWPGAAAASTVLAAALALHVALAPAPAPQIVLVPVQQSSPEFSPEPSGPASAGQGDYLRLRDQAIHEGVDSLPRLPPVSSQQVIPDEFDMPLRPGLRVTPSTQVGEKS